MPKTVKVYKVTAMAELSVHENDDETAIANALERAKSEIGIWTQADCEMVAVLMVNEVGADGQPWEWSELTDEHNT